MSRKRRFLATVMALAASCSGARAAAPPRDDPRTRPVLRDEGAAAARRPMRQMPRSRKAEGGLRLDSRAAASPADNKARRSCPASPTKACSSRPSATTTIPQDAPFEETHPRAGRRPHPMGRDGRPLARRRSVRRRTRPFARQRRADGNHRQGPRPLGLSAVQATRRSHREERRMGPQPDRRASSSQDWKPGA